MRATVGESTVADSQRFRLVFETGIPTRYYLPPEDGHTDLLTPSETRTLCAYKGEAHYQSVIVGGRVHEDIAFSYPDPLQDNPRIRSLICYLNEQADLYLDGEPLERPAT